MPYHPIFGQRYKILGHKLMFQSFFERKTSFPHLYYDMSNKSSTFAYIQTLNKQLWKIKT